ADGALPGRSRTAAQIGFHLLGRRSEARLADAEHRLAGLRVLEPEPAIIAPARRADAGGDEPAAAILRHLAQRVGLGAHVSTSIVWRTRPTRPPTRVPLILIYCRSLPTAPSSRSDTVRASQERTVSETSL